MGYIDISAWASALLVLDRWAMREPVAWNGQQGLQPTLFHFMLRYHLQV